MIIGYQFRTERGIAEVKLRPDGRWDAVFGGEGLGSYASAAQAAEDLAMGVTFTPSAGNTGAFGIPEALEDWRPIVSRR